MTGAVVRGEFSWLSVAGSWLRSTIFLQVLRFFSPSKPITSKLQFDLKNVNKEPICGMYHCQAVYQFICSLTEKRTTRIRALKMESSNRPCSVPSGCVHINAGEVRKPSFISTVRPGFHTKPSQKRSFT